MATAEGISFSAPDNMAVNDAQPQDETSTPALSLERFQRMYTAGAASASAEDDIVISTAMREEQRRTLGDDEGIESPRTHARRDAAHAHHAHVDSEGSSEDAEAHSHSHEHNTARLRRQVDLEKESNEPIARTKYAYRVIDSGADRILASSRNLYPQVCAWVHPLFLFLLPSLSISPTTRVSSVCACVRCVCGHARACVG